MIQISVDLSEQFEELAFTLEKLGAGIFPETAKGVEEGIAIIQQEWIREAGGAFKHSTGSYIHAIQKGMIYPVEMNPYHGRVVNNLSYAEYLEDGYPAFDMKKMLYTSHQVRISKKGKRYLIIPFRHGTPGHQSEAGRAGNRATMNSMPEHVYSPAQRLIMSQLKSKFAVRSVQNKPYSPGNPTVAHRATYEWGERLTKEALENVGASQAEIKKSSGMVRFPREEGRVSGSQYMTFRVMTEDSKGWIHPAQPALKIKERAENKSIPIACAIIEKCFQRDLETIKKLIK